MAGAAKYSGDKSKTGSAQKVYGLCGKGCEHLSTWDFSLKKKKIIIKKKMEKCGV